MIIGHLAAGYVISKLTLHRFAQVNPAAFLLAGMAGAIAPDLDMIYFHLVDHGRYHHHTYFTHFPLVWLGLLVVAALWRRLGGPDSGSALVMIFAINGIAHMMLDTIVGDIWWLAPFIDQSYAFFTVPALYQPWWLNFILHWSFALELCAWAAAIILWTRKTAAANQPNNQ